VTRFERKLGRSGQAIVRKKRQTTIPKRPFIEAGLRIGERMRVRAEGEGRVVFERIATNERLFPLEGTGSERDLLPHVGAGAA
jgi:bifunctional DNA-binding transcriptional regulator/antitoxin component of YhaV-PrlF toxin-antitoxin module